MPVAEMTNQTSPQNQSQMEDQKAKLKQQLNQLKTDLCRLQLAPSLRITSQALKLEDPYLLEGMKFLQHSDVESLQIELLQHLIETLSTDESQEKLTRGEFVEVSHHWVDRPSGIARKASKEVRTILKRQGFDANVRIRPISENDGWVLFCVRPKASLWQLFREFTQAL